LIDEQHGLISDIAPHFTSKKIRHQVLKPTCTLTNVAGAKGLEVHVNRKKQILIKDAKEAGKRFYKRYAAGGACGGPLHCQQFMLKRFYQLALTFVWKASETRSHLVGRKEVKLLHPLLWSKVGHHVSTWFCSPSSLYQLEKFTDCTEL
jgi:hypothetical protein